MTFEGIRPVLHLPFDGGVDEPILEAELALEARTMLAEGADGLVVLGLASEAWTVTESERDLVVEIAADACGAGVPLVVGLEGTTTVAVDRARRAAALGAAGFMTLPPREATTTEALIGHLGAIADATGLPILVQDSPQVTGVRLEVATLRGVADAVPLAASVKSEIPGAGPKASAIVEAGLELVAGWGGLGYLEQLDRGAVGCYPGCDLGPALAAIDRAARAGDRTAAEELYRAILRYLTFATASLDLLLLTAKRHLRRRGIFSTERLRAPGRSLDPQESLVVDRLLDELAAAGTPGFEVV